ncbi:MAG: hypothetical protein ACREJC_18450 [Tepidisphaeraceae bacterium]
MLILAALLACAATAPTNPRVVVVRNEPTVQRITFDPRDPPRQMRFNESAFTQYDFDCRVDVKFEITRARRSANGQTAVTAVIRAVRVELRLDDRMYLPLSANVQLRAHEEGHREINERVYLQAETVAHEEAQKVLGRSFDGVGADEDSAGRSATDAAIKLLGDAYIARIVGQASRVGDIYDDITQHGKRGIGVARAVDQAFARAARPVPATAPAGSS